jgi:hypothetical protein
MTLRSDAREQVKEIIRAEVDSREGYSTSQEEKANLQAVEDEKDTGDAEYKKAITAANKAFIQTKKRRDDLTTRFQAASTELEDQQKNIKTIRTGIENLDSQIARYNQDITTQQQSLKKWLQTEKQGEALMAVIFTLGFKDKSHTLESLADRASAPMMAQYMGVYIQSFTKTINSVLSVDFIRAIEEGTAKWNNEEPFRIELEKGNRGTTYLRLKRYELYPFQSPKAGRVKPAQASKNIKVNVITSRKELDDFLAKNGYSSANYDFNRANSMIKDTAQTNAAAADGLQEQIRSFQDRLNSLQEKIASARSEKEIQLSILLKKEEPHKKAALEVATVQSRKEEADRAFQEAQKSLHEIRRVRESIIIKTARATARGSQSPAEVSAEAIIDKLAEVKNDAKTQHASSTTEVTNFQVTEESSIHAVTEARITSIRLISFINEGDSVRVKMAFRVRTVLEETVEEVPREMPQSDPKAPTAKKRSSFFSMFTKSAEDDDRETAREPEPKKTIPAGEPVERNSQAPTAKKQSSFFSSFTRSAGDDDGKTAGEFEPKKAIPAREPVKRNPKAIGNAEAQDVLFEIMKAKLSGNEISIFVDMTNMADDSIRNVAIYDESYRWGKSKLTDTSGKEYEVSQVVFWKGQMKTSMRDAGSRGVQVDARTRQTAQLIFRKTPSNLKTIKKLAIHPFIYSRIVFVWKWQEHNLEFKNVRVSR